MIMINPDNQKWYYDPSFRQLLRSDPQTALQQIGSNDNLPANCDFVIKTNCEDVIYFVIPDSITVHELHSITAAGVKTSTASSASTAGSVSSLGSAVVGLVSSALSVSTVGTVGSEACQQQ